MPSAMMDDWRRAFVTVLVALVGAAAIVVSPTPAQADPAPFDMDDGWAVTGDLNQPAVWQGYYDQDAPEASKWVAGTNVSLPGATRILFVRLARSVRSRAALMGIQYQATGSTNYFNTYRYDGTTWVMSESNLPVVLGGTLTSAGTQRAFDIAYEQRSGDALVVAADSSTSNISPRYWTWSATTSAWAAMRAIYGTGAGQAGSLPGAVARLRWAKLFPRPDTDEILLAFLDGDNNVWTMLWTGTAWQPLTPGTSAFLENAVVNNSNLNMDGAWEAQGRFLLLYADTSNDTNEPNAATALHYRILDRQSGTPTTWSVERALLYSSPNSTVPDYITASAEPGANRIAVAAFEQGSGSGGFVVAGMWDGNLRHVHCGNTTGSPLPPAGCWQNTTSSSSCGSTSSCVISGALQTIDNAARDTIRPGADPVKIGWVPGQAVLVYADLSASSAGLDYAVWPAAAGGTTWSAATDMAMSAAGEENSFSIGPFHGGNGFLVHFTNDGGPSNNSDQTTHQATYTSTEGWRERSAGAGINVGVDGTPVDVAFNRFVTPTLTISPAALQVPIRTDGQPSDGPQLVISDAGGIIYSEESVGGTGPDADGIQNRDVVIESPVPWHTNADICFPDVTGAAEPRFAHVPCPGLVGDRVESAIVSPGEVAFDVTQDWSPTATTATLLTNGKLHTTGQAAGAPSPLILRTNIRPDGLGGQDWDVTHTSTGTVQLVHSVELSNQGQPGNTFLIPQVQQGTQAAELLRFRLTPVGGEVRVRQLDIVLNPMVGLTAGDVSGITLECGGAPVTGTFTFVGSGPTTLRFATPLTWTFSAAQDCAVRATLTLNPGDELTASLSTAGIIADGVTPSVTDLQTICPDGACNGSAGDAVRLTGATTPAQDHHYATYTVATPSGSLRVGDPWTIQWQALAGATPTAVRVEYQNHAVGLTDLTPLCTITAAGSDGQCVVAGGAPDAASTQMRVHVTDSSSPQVTGSTALFGVGVALGGLVVDQEAGGGWIIGKAYAPAVRWNQTGSATTEVALSLDGGADGYPVSIESAAVTAPSVSSESATFQPGAAHASSSATVRVRDISASHPSAEVLSAAFRIDPAYSNLQPTAGAVLVGQPTSITWSTLAGFSSPSVRITAIGGNPGGLPAGSVSNSGTLSWTPQNAVTGVRLSICDGSQPTVCATGGVFNVVQPSVSTDRTDYTLGDTLNVTWMGMDVVPQVRLMFDPADGTTDIDLLGGGTLPGNAGAFGWIIPTTLAVPVSGTVRVADAANAAIGSNSTSVTLHGAVALGAPTAVDRWLIGSTQNITWTGRGAMTVRLEWALQPGGPYTMITAAGAVSSVPGANTFAWTNMPVAARSPSAVVRMLDVNDPAVVVESPAFHVIGQLQVQQPAAGNTFDIATAMPVTFAWATTPPGAIPQVRVRVLDSANQPIADSTFPAVVTNAGTLPWTPVTTWENVRVEVCDAGDLTVCHLSGAFNISGLQVEAPAAGAVFTLGAGGVLVPVQWKVVGGSGTVRLEYRVGAAGPLTLMPGAASIASPNNATQTFNWMVPVTFADLSNQLMVVVSDVASGPVGTSAAFSIRDALAFVSPAGGTFMVNDPVTIQWNTLGATNAVDLWWSTDDCATPVTAQTRIPVAANVPYGQTSVAWTIPLDAVSGNLRFCLASTVPGHAPTTAMSNAMVVGARLEFDQAPLGGERWAVNEIHPIGWRVIGTVSRIQLEFATEADGFATWQPVGAGIYPISGPSGTINWQVPDVVPYPNGDPSAAPPIPADRDIQIRLRMSNPDTATLPGTVSEIFEAIYYTITWHVQDAESGSLLFGLYVNDSSPWQVFDPTPSLASPGFGLGDARGTVHAYPYGTYTTTYSKAGYTDTTLGGWAADADQTLVLRMESTLSAEMPWAVRTSYEYEHATTQVHIAAFLERRSQLVNLNLLEDAVIEIYDNNAGAGPVATLTAAAPDAAGVYRMTWDASAAVPNVTYFGRAQIRYNSTAYTSGGTFNILIPRTIQELEVTSGGSGGVTLQELQTELAPITTGVDAIRTIVSPLPQQLTDAQGAIQADIANSQAVLSGDIAGVQSTADLIKAETDLISTQVVPKIDGVQAYLADPSAGLPRVLANQTTMQDQLMAQRRGGILNRDMELEQGESGRIRYRSVDDGVAPMINIIDPLGGSVTLPMLWVSQHIFEYPLAGGQLGEYQIIVNEPASAESAGTIDSAVVTVRLPRATGDDVTSLTSQLTALSTQLTTVEANLDGKLTAIQAAMATAAQVDVVITATDALQAKWGALTAADLQNELAAIQTLIGLPATGSLAGDLVPLARTTDLAGLATQASIDALDTKLGTPASGSIAGDIAAIPGAINYIPRFDAIDGAVAALSAAVSTVQTDMAKEATVNSRLDAVDTALTSLSTQVGTPAQQASVDALTVTANAIQAGMARDADLQTALTRLDALQTAMAGLDTKLGTPAFGSIAADVADVKAAITAIPGSIDYSARFDAVDAAMGGLATQVGDPAQRADLAAASAALTLIQTDMARDTDMQVVRTDVASLITSLTALDARVGDPAQQASLDAAIAALGTIQADMAQETSVQSVVSAVGSLQADLTVLSAAVGTPAQAAALAAVDVKVDAVQAAIAALPGATDYTPQLTALQGGVNALATTLGTPASGSIAGDIAAIPGATDYTATLAAIQTDLTSLAGQVNDPSQAARLEDAMTALDGISTQIAAIPGATDYSTNFTALDGAIAGLDVAVTALKTDVAAVPKTDVSADVAATRADVAKLAEGEQDTASVLAKIEELQKAIASAQGSSAAVGLSQGAFSAANEALKILQEIRTQVGTAGPAAPAVPALLGKFGDQLQNVSHSASQVVTIFPEQGDTEELAAQLKKLAEQAKGVASDKGYHFDSLYEMSKTQGTDVKTMRNQVEELKHVLEVQRALLEKTMNQPVMKSWFEAR